MVPSSSVLRSLEAVGLRLARSERAFSDAVHAIHLVRSKLPHTVLHLGQRKQPVVRFMKTDPVKTCTVRRKMTCYRDFQNVAPVRDDGLQ